MQIEFGPCGKRGQEDVMDFLHLVPNPILDYRRYLSSTKDQNHTTMLVAGLLMQFYYSYLFISLINIVFRPFNPSLDVAKSKKHLEVRGDPLLGAL